MEKHLTWNKGFLDSNYQVYEAGQIKCTMFFNTWRSEAKAISQQKIYLFKDDGLYETSTQIFDEDHKLIGMITYNDWKVKATITLSSGENYTCNFINSWHSKWLITNFADKQINYDSSTSSGNVMANTDDELMLLIAFVLFVPMITRAFS